VIGEITGSQKPDEIVLLTCHLDSWDLGQGAVDDGAGCAIILEAARRLGELKPHPRRTVRVVLFANDVFGVSGAKAYAQTHAADLGNTVMAIEADQGAGRPWRLSSCVALENLGYVREVSRALGVLSVSMAGNTAEGGNDLLALAPTRVPLLEIDQDSLAYFDFHYSANDTLDKVNSRDLDYSVAAYVTAAYLAADMEGAFGRAPAPAPALPPQ